MNQQQFENFTASSLYCDKCKAAMPVRERLLLVLPDKEIFDYLCTGCASSVGQREVTAGEKIDGASCERHGAPASFFDAIALIHKPNAHRLSSARAKSACRRCVPLLQLRAPTRRRRHPAGQASRARAADRTAADQSRAVADSRNSRFFNRLGSKVRMRSRKCVRFKPDVIVVMAYGQILPATVLEDPAHRLSEFARLASAALARRGADPGGDRGGRSRNRHHCDVHG